MSRGRGRYDDDLDERSVAKNHKPLIIGLGIGGAAMLLTCICGIGVIGVVFFARGSQPDQFVGTWKGRFMLHGQPTDVIYRLDKSGDFHDEQFDLFGRRQLASGGRWCVRNGRVVIDFDLGGTEVAEAVFVDNNTINYRIISHTDATQVGLQTVFRRQ
jgi:hypothetical protein